MKSTIVAFLLCLVLTDYLAAQRTPSYSRMDFSNAYRMDREDVFPNALTKRGNEDGDFLFKVFPAEVFARHKRTMLSGLRISFTIQNAYKGNYPVFLTMPDVAFFPVRFDSRNRPVVDLAARHARTLPLGIKFVVADGILLHELELGPKQFSSALKTPVVLPARDRNGKIQAWAVALMAPPSASFMDNKAHFVALPSFGEIHRTGPRSFSGIYDARKKLFTMYGDPSAPSNLGELGIEVLIDGPTLQVFSDASGGVRNDPKKKETHMGPGAYDGLLGTSSRPGFFGLYLQWEARQMDGLMVFPLIMALGTPIPDTPLTLPGGHSLLMAPLRRSTALTFFLELGVFGPIKQYKKGGVAGRSTDQNGVFVTPRFPVPNDSSIKGLVLNIQALLTDKTVKNFVGVSNLVQVRF